MKQELNKFLETLGEVCESMENYARCVKQERHTLKEMHTCMRLLASMGEEGTINSVTTISGNLKYSLEKLQSIRDILEKFVKVMRES